MVENVRKCAFVVLMITSVSAYAQNFTKLDFHWDRVMMDGSRVEAAGETPCGLQKKVARVVDAVQPRMAELKKVVGYSDAVLFKLAPESPLSNWYADLMLVQGEKISGRKIDVSVGNFGGIRVDMPKGDVIVDDIRSMFPFKNDIVILEMRGGQLRKLFEQMAATRFEILGGVRVVTHDKKLGSAVVGGQPLDDSKLYTVVSNTFLLHGGDGLYLADLSEKVENTGADMYETVMDYITTLTAAGRHISGDFDGRVISTTSRPLGKLVVPRYVGYAPEYVDDARTAAHNLNILHTNDTHSQIEPIRAGENAGQGGVCERAAFVDSVRVADGRRNVLLVDAGDFEQGTPYFSLFRGKVEIETMNRMKYDAATLGNHEFDNGIDDLAKRMKKAKFKLVLCNYEFSHPGLKRLVKPYTIVRRGGHTIGIIGVLTDVRSVVDIDVARQMKCFDPVDPVNHYAKYLKEEKSCDIVVVLSHLGTVGGHAGSDGSAANDMQLAASTRNVDIIIGGHTHTNLDAPVMVANPDGDMVPVVTDYCRGIYVGEIKIN